jgi:NAD(P)-dependent dehydrogenase (short-subunit alcohol dehydrogenase family)
MDNPSQATERTALVTGATGAIGRAIASQLAAQGYAVVVLSRDTGRGAATAEAIRRTTGNPRVRHEQVDVSRRASVEALAGRWRGPVHVLINNAALTPRTRRETPEGIELQFATNVLGYLWMTQAFQPRLARATDARVVNVASYWAGGLDLDDLEFRRRRYHNDAAYRQSKQADRMLTVALARRLEPLGITVNACHPGDVNSTLSNKLGFGGHESPDEGARTPLWLATGQTGGRVTGRYFEHRRELPCPFGADTAAVETLFEACQAYR